MGKSKGLTVVEEFYIQNNPDKSVEELVQELGKPLDLVKEHIHRTKNDSRVNRLLIREKGCTIMTEGASAASDESRSSRVSQMAIENAIRNGDYEEAARLNNMVKLNKERAEAEAEERQAGHIFYINKPNVNLKDVRK